MDRLARVATAAAALIAAGCGGAAPSAGTGAPLAAGAPPAGPASGLRTARALSRGVLGYAVAYAPGGERLVTVELSTAFELVVRDARYRERRRTALGVADYDVGALALDPTGATAWVASLDGRVRALAVDGDGRAAVEWKLGAPATAVAVAPDGRYVATGDATGVVCLRRARDSALLQCVAAHDGAVGALAFAAGKLASAAHSGEVTIWEVPTLRVLLRRTRVGSANAVAFAPDGDRLAVGWSLAPPVRTPEVVERENRRGFGAPDPHAPVEVLSLAGDATVTIEGHAAAVTAVAWTPDGARVLSASWDRTVRMWDPATGRQVARLGGFAYLVRDLAVAPDGRHLVAAAWAPTLDARATTLVELLYPR